MKVVPYSLILLALTTNLLAQYQPSNVSELADKLEARNTSTSKNSIPYQLFIPTEFEQTQSYPIILFLHGSGERGDDNLKQLSWGVEAFISEEVQSLQKAFVLAPQCPAGKRWVEVNWDSTAHDMPVQPSDALQSVWSELSMLQREFPIDGNRIYVIGLSMGGYGTWDLLQRYGNEIAAAVPICGGGDVKLIDKLVDVPIWAFHSEDDTIVPVQRSRDMFEAVVEQGGQKIRYTEFSTEGHNSWSAPFESMALYRWLFQQSR